MIVGLLLWIIQSLDERCESLVHFDGSKDPFRVGAARCHRFWSELEGVQLVYLQTMSSCWSHCVAIFTGADHSWDEDQHLLI